MIDRFATLTRARIVRICRPIILLALLMQPGCVETVESGGDLTLTEQFTTHPYTRAAGAIADGATPPTVVSYQPDAAYPGLNLYPDVDGQQAFLLDMAGRVVHTLTDKRDQPVGGWAVVKTYRNGDFLVLCEERSIFRITWDSDVVWEVRGPFHHDFAVAPNGDVYAIANGLRYFPDLLDQPAVYDELVVISPEGSIARRIPLVRALAKYPALVRAVRNSTEVVDTWRGRRQRYRDPMHTNTVEVIPREVAGPGTVRFAAGDILFCMPSINTIGVLDPERLEIRWHWGRGYLDWPHSPTLLDNDRILVFDNNGGPNYSRVLEVDPRTNRITHEISGSPTELNFFSDIHGQAFRLPNGNVVVNASQAGRIFEVTPDRRVVWQLQSLPPPHDPSNVAAPYRIQRILEHEMPPPMREAWQRVKNQPPPRRAASG